MCAPSCHDCSTMRAWWEENEERRCRFYKTVVGSSDIPPAQCVPDVAYFILRQHFDAPSMWAIFPLQVQTLCLISFFLFSFAYKDLLLAKGLETSLSKPLDYLTCMYIFSWLHDQDLLALKEEYITRPAVEETINDPTNPKHYWRYRK